MVCVRVHTYLLPMQGTPHLTVETYIHEQTNKYINKNTHVCMVCVRVHTSLWPMQGTPHFTVETYIHEQSPAKETQSLVNIHQRCHLNTSEILQRLFKVHSTRRSEERLTYTKKYLEKRPIQETCKRDLK